MALIKCPECGKDISDRAFSCPNCGFPIREQIKDGSVSTTTSDHNQTNESNDPIIKLDETVKCRVCGAALAQGQRICKTCGTIVKGSETSYYHGSFTNNSANAATVSTANANYASINDIFIWLLSVLLLFSLGMTYLKGPIYIVVVVWIFNLVCVILDYNRLEKAGIKVNKLCFVLGALLLYPIYVIARTAKTKRVVPCVVYLVLFVVLILFSGMSLASNTVNQMNNRNSSYMSVMREHDAKTNESSVDPSTESASYETLTEETKPSSTTDLEPDSPQTVSIPLVSLMPDYKDFIIKSEEIFGEQLEQSSSSSHYFGGLENNYIELSLERSKVTGSFAVAYRENIGAIEQFYTSINLVSGGENYDTQMQAISDVMEFLLEKIPSTVSLREMHDAIVSSDTTKISKEKDKYGNVVALIYQHKIRGINYRLRFAGTNEHVVGHIIIPAFDNWILEIGIDPDYMVEVDKATAEAIMSAIPSDAYETPLPSIEPLIPIEPTTPVQSGTVIENGAIQLWWDRDAPTGLNPVRIGEVGDWGGDVVLLPNRTLQQFKLLRVVGWDFDWNPVFETRLDVGMLEAGQAVKFSVPFGGDSLEHAISFLDETGQVCIYGIEPSAMDGSLHCRKIQEQSTAHVHTDACRRWIVDVPYKAAEYREEKVIDVPYKPAQFSEEVVVDVPYSPAHYEEQLVEVTDHTFSVQRYYVRLYQLNGSSYDELYFSSEQDFYNWIFQYEIKCESVGYNEPQEKHIKEFLERVMYRQKDDSICIIENGELNAIVWKKESEYKRVETRSVLIPEQPEQSHIERIVVIPAIEERSHIERILVSEEQKEVGHWEYVCGYY